MRLLQLGFLPLAIVWITASGSPAQIVSHMFEHDGFPRFSVDYASFKSEDSLNYVEIYTQISFKDLQFVKRGSGYVAHCEIEVSIYQNEIDLVSQRTFRDTIVVDEFERTSSTHEYRIAIQAFKLAPGKYEAVIVMRDLETGRAVSQNLDLLVKDYYQDSITISDLQFARRIAFNEDSSPFSKNGRFIEPNVARAYGYLANNIYLYYEVYGLKTPPDSVRDHLIVHYKIMTPEGKIRKYIKKKTSKPGKNCVHSVLIPVADLESGRYILEVEVFDIRDMTRSARATKDFIVGWDFLAFGGFTSDELIEQLRLIASPEQIEQLKHLPERFRRAGILSFWKSKDPTPDTEINELMLEFYHRISVANRKFSTKDLKGWQTDQGKIYVKYGPPDSIQRYFTGKFDKPYEVWVYSDPNLKFIFVDEQGYGRYQLYTDAVAQEWQEH